MTVVRWRNGNFFGPYCIFNVVTSAVELASFAKGLYQDSRGFTRALRNVILVRVDSLVRVPGSFGFAWVHSGAIGKKYYVKFAYKRGQTGTGISICFARMRSTEKHKQNGGVHNISLPSTLYSGHRAF